MNRQNGLLMLSPFDDREDARRVERKKRKMLFGFNEAGLYNRTADAVNSFMQIASAHVVGIRRMFAKEEELSYSRRAFD